MDLQPGYVFEQSLTCEISGHPDSIEAVRATLERRPPVYLSCGAPGTEGSRMAQDRRTASLSVADFRRQARAWLADADIPQLPASYAGRPALLRAWHRTLYAAGWVGIQWPRDVGGRGLTVHHQIAFNEELARARAPQPAGAIGLEIVGPTILKYGTRAQRYRFIQPLLAGDEVWCQGFSEPGAGSDLASLRTSAVRDGDELVITGQKIWTSWATDTDWCALLVRTDPAAGEAAPGDQLRPRRHAQPGSDVKPIVMLNGDAEFNELFFDQVRVPVANVLGDLNGGWVLAMDTLGWERAGYSIRRQVENEVAFQELLDQVARSPGGPGARRRTSLPTSEPCTRSCAAFKALTRRTAERLADGVCPRRWTRWTSSGSPRRSRP